MFCTNVLTKSNIIRIKHFLKQWLIEKCINLFQETFNLPHTHIESKDANNGTNVPEDSPLVVPNVPQNHRVLHPPGPSNAPPTCQSPPAWGRGCWCCLWDKTAFPPLVEKSFVYRSGARKPVQTLRNPHPTSPSTNSLVRILGVDGCLLKILMVVVVDRSWRVTVDHGRVRAVSSNGQWCLRRN